MSKALVIVDVQASMFFGPWPVPGAAELLQRIGDRLLKARLEGEQVVHVQNDGPEDEMDAPGEPWWELVLAPKETELVVRKTHQNVFESNPDLADELRAKGITVLELVGVQSDMCLGELVLAPKETELAVRKTHQNVFESNPDLADELRAKGITELELVGVQSDMCLGESAKGAHALGFKISVDRKLHGTYDGGFPGSEDPTPAGEISDRIQRELETL